MTYFHAAWLEHQRKRFTRADAYRFAPSGTPEAKPPGWLDPSETRVRLKEAQEAEARAQAAAEQEEFERDLLELRWLVKSLRTDLLLRDLRHKYSPNQPRAPSGTPDGGQWTSGGGVGHAASGSAQPTLTDASPDPIRPGAQYAQGDPPPPLQRIHPDSTYERDPEARRSLDYWRKQTTPSIVESLKPGGNEPLTAYPDGRVADGNTRLKVLQERGYNINLLPRTPRGGGGGLPSFWPWQ